VRRRASELDRAAHREEPADPHDVPVDVTGGAWLDAIPPESNPSESSSEPRSEARVAWPACDEADPRSARIAPKKARSADMRSAVFALRARARAAAMREGPRAGRGEEAVMGDIEPAGGKSSLKEP
jgi:hypothetical protein